MTATWSEPANVRCNAAKLHGKLTVGPDKDRMYGDKVIYTCDYPPCGRLHRNSATLTKRTELGSRNEGRRARAVKNPPQSGSVTMEAPRRMRLGKGTGARLLSNWGRNAARVADFRCRHPSGGQSGEICTRAAEHDSDTACQQGGRGGTERRRKAHCKLLSSADERNERQTLIFNGAQIARPRLRRGTRRARTRLTSVRIREPKFFAYCKREEFAILLFAKRLANKCWHTIAGN